MDGNENAHGTEHGNDHDMQMDRNGRGHGNGFVCNVMEKNPMVYHGLNLHFPS